MHYDLSFFDYEGNVRDVCAADIATEAMAIQWMRIVGAAWVGHWSRPYDWSRMELWCEGQCVARVQAALLDSVPIDDHHPVAAALGQNLNRPEIPPLKRDRE